MASCGGRIRVRLAGRASRYVRLGKSEHPAVTAVTGTVEGFTKRYAVTAEELKRALGYIGGVLR